jgi:hypothetical protein
MCTFCFHPLFFEILKTTKTKTTKKKKNSKLNHELTRACFDCRLGNSKIKHSSTSPGLCLSFRPASDSHTLDQASGKQQQTRLRPTKPTRTHNSLVSHKSKRNKCALSLEIHKKNSSAQRKKKKKKKP